VPQPTYLSFLGLAKEITRGTPAAATDFLPVKTMTPHDDQAFLADQGMRGSQVTQYDNIPGPRFSTYAVGGDVFPDTFGYLLASMLGDVYTTGAAAPFGHAMSVLNSGDGQPPSLTLTDYDAVNARLFPGMIVSDLSVAFDAAGMLGYTATLSGLPSALGAKPAQSFSQVQPQAVWRGIAQVGGATDLTVISGSVDIKRVVTVIHNVDGSQSPYRVWGGPVTVTGKLVAVSESTAGVPDPHLAAFIAGTQNVLDFDFLQGAGAATSELRLHASKANYTVANNVRGKDYVEVDLTFEANANSTDAGASGGYSPLKATVQSAKPAGTYR